MAYLTCLGRDEINGFDKHPSNWNPPTRSDAKGKHSAQKLPTLDKSIDQRYGAHKWYRPYSGQMWEDDPGYYSGNPLGLKSGYEKATEGAKERIKILVKWAVFYSACAILWVMTHSDFTDDTSLDRVNGDPYFRVPQVNSPDRDTVSREWTTKYGKSTGVGEDSYVLTSGPAGNVWISLGILIPVAALAILPAAGSTALSNVRGKSKIPEEDKNTSEISAILNQLVTP